MSEEVETASLCEVTFSNRELCDFLNISVHDLHV